MDSSTGDYDVKFYSPGEAKNCFYTQASNYLYYTTDATSKYLTAILPDKVTACFRIASLHTELAFCKGVT